jgi:hypothetical protein
MLVGPTDPGESVVLLFPCISDAIWHTAGVDYVVNTTPRELFMYPALLESTTLTSTFGGRLSIGHALVSNGHAIVPRLDAAGFYVYEMLMSLNSATQVLRVTLSSEKSRKTSYEVTLRAEYRIAGGTIWTAVNTVFTMQSGSGYADFRGPGGAINIGAMRFSVSDPRENINDYTISLGNAFDADNPPIIQLPATSACHYILRDFDQLVGMQQTTNERPAALAGLVTWMGSTLENGGNIAAARLPMGMTPLKAPGGDYYGYLSQLPIYASDFPLKDGAYAWWAPDSEQEYFFTEYLNTRSTDLELTSCLAFAMRRDQPSQTVRFRADANFETQTRSVQYASAVGATNAQFPRALEIAKMFPAVTINDDHISLLSKKWKEALGKLKNPANWLGLIRRGVSWLLK